MKTKAIGIVCLVLAIGLFFRSVGHTQPSPAVSGQNGRFQVINATIDFSATGGMPAHQTVIRVDTQTGKAWELFEEKGSSGVGIETLWVPVTDVK